MGNQPSSPSGPPPPSQPVTSPPPLPPPCDLNCQKQKNLVLLKTALDTATENQSQDPAGYEKARIAYYTLLNGQGWLNTEKQRIATEEVKPVLDNYKAQFKTLKGEKQSQSIFTNLSNALIAAEKADGTDNAFLKKQLASEKDKTDVMNRLNEFNSNSIVTSQPTSYLPLIMDVVTSILIIGVLYLGFTKVEKIKNMFGFSSSVTNIAT